MRRRRMLRAMATAAAPPKSCSVAVIGAGAAGLAAARELLREGHTPWVFEQGRATGGVWVYSNETDETPLGANDPTKRAHSRWGHSSESSGSCHGSCCSLTCAKPSSRSLCLGDCHPPKPIVSQSTWHARIFKFLTVTRAPPRSMYVGLRTNLPRELMGFTDFPFTPSTMEAAGTPSVDPRRFPSHTEVLAYLRAYTKHHNLEKHIRFQTRVLLATPIGWSGDGSSSSSSGGDAAGAGVTRAGDASDEPVTVERGPRWAVTYEVLVEKGAQREERQQVGGRGVLRERQV